MENAKALAWHKENVVTELRRELQQAMMQVSRGSCLAEQQQRQLESASVKPVLERFGTLRTKTTSDPFRVSSLAFGSSSDCWTPCGSRDERSAEVSHKAEQIHQDADGIRRERTSSRLQRVQVADDHLGSFRIFEGENDPPSPVSNVGTRRWNAPARGWDKLHRTEGEVSSACGSWTTATSAEVRLPIFGSDGVAIGDTLGT